MTEKTNKSLRSYLKVRQSSDDKVAVAFILTAGVAGQVPAAIYRSINLTINV